MKLHNTTFKFRAEDPKLVKRVKALTGPILLIAGYEEDQTTMITSITGNNTIGSVEYEFVELDARALLKNLKAMSSAKDVEKWDDEISAINVTMPDDDSGNLYRVSAKINHRAGIYEVGVYQQDEEYGVVKEEPAPKAKETPNRLRPMLEDFAAMLGKQFKMINVRVPEDSVDMVRFENAQARPMRSARIDRIYDEIADAFGKDLTQVDADYGVAYVANIGRRMQVRLSVNIEEDGKEALRGITLRQLKPLKR